MKMSTILGGVASSAVIVAMAVVYPTAREAKAAVDPTYVVPAQEQLAFEPTTPMKPLQAVAEVYTGPSLAPEDSIRPKRRPNALLPASVYNDDQLYCLAQNIYFESRGESLEGQAAVGWVTLNRLLDADHPDTICEVVWEDSQFSWTHDGKSDKPRDAVSWDRAQDIALDLVYSYDPNLDPTSGSTYFHEQSISPGWSKRFDRIGQIDNHVFYVDRG